jgi:hypothetical protein
MTGNRYARSNQKMPFKNRMMSSYRFPKNTMKRFIRWPSPIRKWIWSLIIWSRIKLKSPKKLTRRRRKSEKLERIKRVENLNAENATLATFPILLSTLILKPSIMESSPKARLEVIVLRPKSVADQNM